MSLKAGDTYFETCTITKEQIQQFAEVTGDNNPIHLDESYAKTTKFKSCIAHGVLILAQVSRILGTKWPGNGTIYCGQDITWEAPVRADDQMRIYLSVVEVNEAKKRASIFCSGQVKETQVFRGIAKIIYP